MSSNLRKDLLQSGLGGLPPKVPPGISNHKYHGHKRDYSPLEWTKFFATKEVVQTSDTDKFTVYGNSSDGAEKSPVLVLLHGGGFSALTWALFAADVIKKVRVRVMAIDLRGHGDTVTANDLDLSSETMAKDVTGVILKKFCGERPDVLLVGHSMGGALAVHAALLGEIDNLIGICVIDVVEGTAVDALSSMQTFLRSRPSKFNSLEFAIEWSVRSGQVRNTESARVSMPGQLKSLRSGFCGTQDVGKDVAIGEETKGEGEEETSANNYSDTIAEEDEEADEFKSPPKPTTAVSSSVHPGYTWRIDLASTESHWPGWFKDLSQKFLSVSASKLLLLAGVDRLDRELTVGQMQGRFQMQVLPQAGHAVHEDVPDKVADVIATFLVRNKIAEAMDDFHRTFPAC